MAEHVAERADAQLAFEHFRPRFADPCDVLYVVVEILHRTNIRSFPRFRIPRLRFPPSGRVSRACIPGEPSGRIPPGRVFRVNLQGVPPLGGRIFRGRVFFGAGPLPLRCARDGAGARPDCSGSLPASASCLRGGRNRNPRHPRRETGGSGDAALRRHSAPKR